MKEIQRRRFQDQNIIIGPRGIGGVINGKTRKTQLRKGMYSHRCFLRISSLEYFVPSADVARRDAAAGAAEGASAGDGDALATRAVEDVCAE
jgi:hypothetical protein